MSRFVRLAVFALVGLALLLPGAAMAKKKKKKHVIKAKTELEAGQPLRVDIAGDLTSCEEWDCWLFIGEVKDDFLYMLEFATDGSWVAYAMEEDHSEDEEGEDEDEEDEDEEAEELTVTGETGVKVAVEELPEEDCTKIKLKEEEEDEKKKKKKKDEEEAEEVDEGPPDWMDLHVLTMEERLKCHRRNGAAGYLTVEKVRGEISGELPTRFVMVPADLLPAGDFEVATNGHWGAMIDGEKVGWKEKTGVIRILR